MVIDVVSSLSHVAVDKLTPFLKDHGGWVRIYFLSIKFFLVFTQIILTLNKGQYFIHFTSIIKLIHTNCILNSISSSVFHAPQLSGKNAKLHACIEYTNLSLRVGNLHSNRFANWCVSSVYLFLLFFLPFELCLVRYILHVLLTGMHIIQSREIHFQN